jgi:hypothetical protein
MEVSMDRTESPYSSKETLVAYHRRYSARLTKMADEPKWDEEAKREWLRLAERHSRRAERVEESTEYDSAAEKARDQEQDGAFRSIIKQFCDRKQRERRAFDRKSFAAVRSAREIACHAGLTPMTLTTVFNEYATPQTWTISYFAQSRYRGGMIRATVEHETARLIEAEIQFE